MTPNALILKIHVYPGQICRRKKKKKSMTFSDNTQMILPFLLKKYSLDNCLSKDRKWKASSAGSSVHSHEA